MPGVSAAFSGSHAERAGTQGPRGTTISRTNTLGSGAECAFCRALCMAQREWYGNPVAGAYLPTGGRSLRWDH